MLLMAMIYYSCTSVHMIRHNQSDYDEMNEDLDERKVTILKTTKEVIFGHNVMITPDSTFWLNSQQNKLSVLTSGIREITSESAWRGAKDGFYYGFLFGAGFGVVVALLVDKSSGAMDPKAFAPMIGIGAGVGAGVWGLVIGAAIGHTDRYIFQTPAD